MFTAAYLRVSTADQTTDNQLKELEVAGYAPTAVFKDENVSGKVPAMERPDFVQMVATLERLNGSTAKRVVVTKVDRLGRNAADILTSIERFKKMGVKVIVLQLDGVDVTSPMGKLIVTTLSAVSEMEHALIVERTHAGLARARAEGKTLGRPDRLTKEQKAAIRERLAAGEAVAALAREFNVARGTIRSTRT